MLARRVAIVGVGLIGGSLGMVIRQRKLAREVVGIARRRATLTQALRCKAITHGTLSLADGIAGADLVILATPPSHVCDVLQALSLQLVPGAVVTDVASTKTSIVATAARIWSAPVPFVGAHPMAGSERQGVVAAQADLFDGQLCIVTPTLSTDPRALRLVTRFWKACGSRVVMLTPRMHDRWVAAISHVPHLLAAALVNATPPAQLALAPRSFRDVTRIAQSDPALWCDILTDNRSAALEALARVNSQVSALRSALLRRNDAALVRALVHAQRLRASLA